MTINSNNTTQLFEAISKLNSPEECAAFFEDLCTITEIQAMTQRFDTAIMLAEGKNYKNISDSVGASSATISRVNRCLNYGAGGYTTAISRLMEDNNNGSN